MLPCPSRNIEVYPCPPLFGTPTNDGNWPDHPIAKAANVRRASINERVWSWAKSASWKQQQLTKAKVRKAIKSTPHRNHLSSSEYWLRSWSTVVASRPTQKASLQIFLAFRDISPRSNPSNAARACNCQSRSMDHVGTSISLLTSAILQLIATIAQAATSV